MLAPAELKQIKIFARLGEGTYIGSRSTLPISMLKQVSI